MFIVYVWPAIRTTMIIIIVIWSAVVISQGLRIFHDRDVVDCELTLSRDFYANIISPENVKTTNITCL